jgi:serine/threonine-protein kinase
VWAIAGVGLVCAVIVALAIFGVVALVRENHGGTQTAAPTTPTHSASAAAPASAAPAQAPVTEQLRATSLPGTDYLGWTAYPHARCDSGNQPAVMARTTKSVLVVCQIQPGDFYYRGVRLSDAASIELANAVRSSEGFDVTNPADGTRYQIRPTSLTIAPPDGPASSEPMLQYASS